MTGRNQAIAKIFGEELLPAYLLIGPVGCIQEELEIIFSPDDYALHIIAKDKLLIDDCRLISSKQRLADFNSRPKVFIINASIVGPEAQNALLKTLEEPTAQTHFFLITEREENYLSTVRSRCQLLKWPTQSGSPENVLTELAASFSKLTPFERLRRLEEYLIIGSEGDKERLDNFLCALELVGTASNTARLWDIRRKLNTNLASARLLAEELALC